LSRFEIDAPNLFSHVDFDVSEQKTLEKTKTKKNKVELRSKKWRKSDDKADEVDSVSDGQNSEKKKKKTTKLGLERKRRVEKGNETDSNNGEFFLAFILV